MAFVNIALRKMAPPHVRTEGFTRYREANGLTELREEIEVKNGRRDPSILDAVDALEEGHRGALQDEMAALGEDEVYVPNRADTTTERRTPGAVQRVLPSNEVDGQHLRRGAGLRSRSEGGRCRPLYH